MLSVQGIQNSMLFHLEPKA